MAYTLNTKTRDTQVDHHSDDCYNSAILEIRTGAAPGPSAAATGTVLASITIPAAAHNASASGSATKAGTWEDTSADATGTAAHFRIRASGDANGADATVQRVEGTVGQGSGDLSLNNTSIAAGQTVTINTWTLTQPAS